MHNSREELEGHNNRGSIEKKHQNAKPTLENNNIVHIIKKIRIYKYKDYNYFVFLPYGTFVFRYPSHHSHPYRDFCFCSISVSLTESRMR